MTDSQLEEAKRLVEAATRLIGLNVNAYVPADALDTAERIVGVVPELIAEVERLRADLAKVKSIAEQGWSRAHDLGQELADIIPVYEAAKAWRHGVDLSSSEDVWVQHCRRTSRLSDAIDAASSKEAK